jgi:phage shock protein A
MGLFSALFTLGKGKSDQAAEAIEDKNRVLFAEQALKDIEAELQKAQKNFGSMKAQVMGIDRDVADKSSEYDGWISKAKELKAAGNEELALKAVNKSIVIKEELASLEQQKTLVSNHLKQQETNVTTLRGKLDVGKRDIQSMKSIEQVTRSTESILDVNQSGVNNALSKFEGHKRKAQMELDEKNALLEAQNAGNLDAEIDAALGGNDAEAKNLLDSL